MDKIKSQPSSIIALILVNLYPVFGVLFWGWEIFPIMFLYWTENVVIGFYNVLRMIACNDERRESWKQKLFLIPFFIFHYGGFTAGHGIFVILIFGRQNVFVQRDLPNLHNLWVILQEKYVLYAILAIFISHGYSFVKNYLQGGEYKLYSLSKLMRQPYGRIILMHTALIFGALLVVALKTPMAGLLLFILLKIIMDLWAHMKEHRVLNS